MRVLLIGTGGVGTAVARIVRRYDPEARWLERLILADADVQRAREVAAALDAPERFVAARLNARRQSEIVALARKESVDLILNGCDPSFNVGIFEAAFTSGCTYMDMALSLSQKHPQRPYRETYVKLGDYQFQQAQRWEREGRLAIVGSGVEPGMADVFARYAEKHLFDTIEEIGIRDGNNLTVEGYDIAFGFSIWTTIEECLNPPVVWERGVGWYTTEPFSDPEVFHLPEGIGPVEMVNVEHEEVILIPRYIDKGLRKVTFKYGLGEEFIQAMKNIQALNLDRKDIKVKVGESRIAPRDFLARTAPDPTRIGHLMTGKTCAGTWIKGTRDGLERQVYLYQVADNQACLDRLDSPAVTAQAAFAPVIMMELLARGSWAERGVCGPEAFDPDPFVARMAAYDFPGGLLEMESEYLHRVRREAFVAPLGGTRHPPATSNPKGLSA